jgi:DNA-binding response OmpR family regulator
MMTSATTAKGTRTILVVDDEPAILMLLRRVLEEQGYAVLTAASWDEGLRVCNGRKGPIDLVLMDIFLPQKPGQTEINRDEPTQNGLKLVRWLKAVRAQMKTIYISSLPGCLIEALGGIPQGDVLLPKPFHRQTLIETVKKVLEGKPVQPFPALSN